MSSMTVVDVVLRTFDVDSWLTRVVPSRRVVVKANFILLQFKAPK